MLFLCFSFEEPHHTLGCFESFKFVHHSKSKLAPKVLMSCTAAAGQPLQSCTTARRRNMMMMDEAMRTETRVKLPFEANNIH